MPLRKILLTSTHKAPFILEDLTLLQQHAEVTHLLTRGVLSPFTIFRTMWSCDVTFTWFASVYAFFVVATAWLLRKPSLVVIAGADVVSLPDIGYGLWHIPWKRWVAGWALRHATRVLAVDSSLRDSARSRAQYDGANIVTIPTGYDPQRWTPCGDKEAVILTVAGCENQVRMKVKGLDFLFAVARRMESVQFIIVGMLPSLLHEIHQSVPPNVTVVPAVPRDGLLDYYRRAMVYCQPSRSEGLPNSVCEAMLCECIPVGTDVGGVSRAIGETGFVVPFGDESGMVEALQRALADSGDLRKKARERIAREFPLTKRADALRRLLEEVAP